MGAEYFDMVGLEESGTYLVGGVGRSESEDVNLVVVDGTSIERVGVARIV